jgi:hypothetical protein
MTNSILSKLCYSNYKQWLMEGIIHDFLQQ